MTRKRIESQSPRIGAVIRMNEKCNEVIGYLSLNPLESGQSFE